MDNIISVVTAKNEVDSETFQAIGAAKDFLNNIARLGAKKCYKHLRIVIGSGRYRHIVYSCIGD